MLHAPQPPRPRPTQQSARGPHSTACALPPEHDGSASLCCTRLLSCAPPPAPLPAAPTASRPRGHGHRDTVPSCALPHHGSASSPRHAREAVTRQMEYGTTASRPPIYQHNCRDAPGTGKSRDRFKRTPPVSRHPRDFPWAGGALRNKRFFTQIISLF